MLQHTSNNASSSAIAPNLAVKDSQVKELAIAFESWKPNPNKPGYLSFNGVKSAKEIERQINDALKAIPFDRESNAYDCAEYISMHGKYQHETFEVPKHGQPIVFYRHGNSEGYLVEIWLRKDERFYEVCRIKYLVDVDAVASVVHHLITACNNGLYGES